MQFSNAPGMMWFSDVKIHAWSADWAIVLHYDDAEESPSAAFPKILGFARRDRYPRSAGTLLASMPSYWVYAEAEVEGDNLLSTCWMRHGDEGQVSLGELLLRLDDETLGILAGEYFDLGSRSLFEAIEAIREFVCEYWPDEDEDEAVWFAFSRYGTIKDNGGLGALLRALEEDRDRLEEERERREEEEKRRREAEERARYEAAPALDPESFGAGVTVDRLTEGERLSLRKWMERDRGLARSEVSYRQSGGWRRPAGHELTIAFDSGGLRRTTSFRAPFPTVATAFRKALAQAAEGGKPKG